MPPKGSDSSNKGGAHNKQAAKIKKPSLQSSNNSKGRGNPRGGARGNTRSGSRANRSIIDEEDTNNDLNNSMNSTLNDIKEEKNWLNEIPPVIKADEELHIKLLKERKERDDKKHFDICQSELRAMLNIALTEVDLPLDDRNNFLKKTKVDYFNGLYHDPISNTPRTPKSNKSTSTNLPILLNKNEYEINNKNSDFFQLKLSIQQLINANTNTFDDSFKNFNLQTAEASSTFDINPELNNFFSIANKEMQPYINQSDSFQLLNFPFLICIVGPPCSGKSTICQFIATHFNVYLISVVDPDTIVNSKNSLNTLIETDLTPNANSNTNSRTPSKLNSNINSTDNSFIGKEVEDSNKNNINSLNSPFIICSSDDKVIINSIITEISDLPENKGVVIVNYPYTKAQLTQLEKSLQAAMKKKGDGKFGTINGLIRASMTADEAARQVQKRLIDKSTGLVFHSIFNPPDFSPNSKFNTEPYPCQVVSNINSARNQSQTSKGNLNSKNSKNNSTLLNIDKISLGSSHPVMETYADLAPIYSKLNQQLALLDNLMKKIGPFLSVGFCSSIGQLNLLIESFLKAVYKSKNIDPPFTSFVVFETQDQFYYSKLCYNVFQIWNKECITQFGKQIGSLCNRLKQSKSQIDFLLGISMQMFSLIISKQDDRRAKTIEFINSQDEIRTKIMQLQSIKEEKEANKRVKQSYQSNEICMIQPRANTCLAPRAKTALSPSPIKQKKAVMTIRTRNLYLRNVFPNVNISDLENNRNIKLKTPDSIKFKRISNIQYKKRPLTAISDIHKNLNLNSVFDSDLNKIDTDKEIEKELKNLFELQIDFYHDIWQQSIELRNRNTKVIDRFIRRSPIKAFKSIMEENEKIIFNALLKRFFLVDWYSSNIVPLLEKKEENEDIQISNTNVNNNSFLSLKIQNQKPNFRQGSKLNLPSEIVLLESESSSKVNNKYNITDFPHPIIPKYDVTNLKELCSLMHIEFKEPEFEKGIDIDNSLRFTKSNETITPSYQNSHFVPKQIETGNNSDEFLSSDSNSFAYLQTPKNQLNNMSKTPTTSNNIWDLDPPSSKVAASCRVGVDESHLDKEKKKLYFPPIISFEHQSSSLHSSAMSRVISSRTAISSHPIPSSSEKIDTIDDDSEANFYSDSTYSYEKNEEEEIENDNDKKQPTNQLPFPFHFPERRKRNRLSLKQPQIDSNYSSLSSIDIDNKTDKKPKPKTKKEKIDIKIKIGNNDSKSDVKNDSVFPHQAAPTHRHHHRMSKEEAINNFLSYLQIETNDRTLKPEAKVMQEIFHRFLNDKTLVDGQIDNELKVLRENLQKMIHQKCAKEMESFSRRFRAYRDRIEIEMKHLKKDQQFQMQSILNSELDQQSNTKQFEESTQTLNDRNDENWTSKKKEEKEPEIDIDIDNLTPDALLLFDTSYMTDRCIKIVNTIDCNFKSLSYFFEEENEVKSNNENDQKVDTNKLQKLYSYYYNRCLNNDNDSNDLEKTESAANSSKLVDEKKDEVSDIQKVSENLNRIDENNKDADIADDDETIVDVPNCFVSLDDLCDVMDSLEFTEKEKLYIEACVRVKTIPEFINILYFIRSILPEGIEPCIDVNLTSPNIQNNICNSSKNSNRNIPDQVIADDTKSKSLVDSNDTVEKEKK